MFLPFWHDCGSTLQYGGRDTLTGVVAKCESQVSQAPLQFTCECAAGWRGNVCDEPTGCDADPCGAHGACAATGNSYVCTCDAGWSGPHCDVNQCSLPYTTVSDSWRSTKHSSGNKGDNQLGDPQCPNDPRYSSLIKAPTGVGGGKWYRFVGEGGDALPLHPISSYDPTHGMFAKDGNGAHCGFSSGGWLSGWPGGDACATDADCPSQNPQYPSQGHIACLPSGRCGPTWRYHTAGSYPSVADGVVNRTVCFDQTSPGYPNYCHKFVGVQVVRCEVGGFLLWRLPYANYRSSGCSSGYCTATDLSEGRSTGCDVAGHAPGSVSPCGQHATCVANGDSHSCVASVRTCFAMSDWPPS